MNSIVGSTKDDQQQTKDTTLEQQEIQEEMQENNQNFEQQENNNNIRNFKSNTAENSKNTVLRQSKSQDNVLAQNKLYNKTPKSQFKKKLKSVKKVYNDTRPPFSITNNNIYPLKDVSYNPLTDQHLRGYF